MDQVMYVADTDNNSIRKITSLTTGVEDLTSISDIKFYPVPARQSLTLGLTLQSDGNLKLKLMNVSGIEVTGMEGNYASGLLELTLSVANLPAGIYVANVYFNGQLKNQRIIIER